MNWLIAVPVAWAVLALVLGLLIGRGIRMERGPEPECPALTGAGLARAATGPVEEPLPSTVAVGALSSTPGHERHGERTRESALTGVR